MSEEQKKKLSIYGKLFGHRPPSWAGKKHTAETRKKMSETAKRRTPFTLEHKQNIKKNHKGNIGKKFTLAHRKNLSNSHKRLVAEGTHPSWKGGVTPTNKLIRNSIEYKLWRESVFRRDNWTCVWCGVKGGTKKDATGKWITIQADHIKRFADYPELRFAIDNGRTLCVSCHKTTETYLNPHYYEKY